MYKLEFDIDSYTFILFSVMGFPQKKNNFQKKYTIKHINNNRFAQIQKYSLVVYAEYEDTFFVH